MKFFMQRSLAILKRAFLLLELSLFRKNPKAANRVLRLQPIPTRHAFIIYTRLELKSYQK
jgi:hypothetical protein